MSARRVETGRRPSLAHLIAVAIFAGLGLFAQPAIAHDIYSAPPNPVVGNSSGRTFTFTNVSLAGQGNIGRVNPGAAVSVSFGWTYTQAADRYCPTCSVTAYYGMAGTFSTCFYQHPSGEQSASGTVNQGFAAPTKAGVYYLTWDMQLDECRDNGGVHRNEPDYAVAVLIVGQEPWEVSTVANHTGYPAAINTPVLSGDTYTNLYGLPGLAIVMPTFGFISFTPKGHNTTCRSPYWGVQIDYRNKVGTETSWTYYYDTRGEIGLSLAADGTPSFSSPRGGTIVVGLTPPPCAS